MFPLRKLIFGPLSAEKIAEKIVRKITHSSFRFFRDEEIREMLSFSKIDQTEQDRIFNELVVTGLSLSILTVETVSNLSEGEKSAVFRELSNEISARYPNWLEKLGVDKKYTDIWRQLIEMRCDEYQKDFKKYRKELPDPRKKNPWISVVAIGGLHHLRRGKTSPQDPLFKQFLPWLRGLAIQIEKIIIHAI